MCAFAAVFLVLSLQPANQPNAATPNPSDDSTLYVMPLLTAFESYTDQEFAQEVAQLRSRLPEGRGVKVGFSAYIYVAMQDANANSDDPASVRAGLKDTIAQIDRILTRARAHNVGVQLSLITALRETYDKYQVEAQARDRRNMQWYSDNQMAPGWVTYSRYARTQRKFIFASIQELGKVLANRMATYPDTLLAISGDGEVELSLSRAQDPANTFLADYSPFAILEFRDWLTARGLYAAGQPFAAEAYEFASRYTNDLTPATDESGDGHTLNGDFQTTFGVWGLKFFDWSLSDPLGADTKAIPAAVFEAPGFDPNTGTSISNGAGFDAPRARAPRTAWLNAWHAFRSSLVWRYNQEFAKSITTSVDSATGQTVPARKFYSYQIAADYIFNATPANPNGRLESSASSLQTADVTPHGGTGFTSFNINVGGNPNQSFLTLRNLAPAIGAKDVRWAILEWHPAVPASGTFDAALDNIEFYREDMALVEKYKGSLVVPYAWDYLAYKFKDTNFEVALRELLLRIPTNASWRTDKTSLRFTAIRNSTGIKAITSAQELLLNQAGFQGRAWAVTVSKPWVKASLMAGSGSARLMISIDPATAPRSGSFDEILSIGAADGTGTPAIVNVHLNVSAGAANPFGTFDTPAHNSTALSGSVGITGWALDDVEVTKVEIWRDPHPSDPAAAIAPAGSAQSGKVFIADATFIDGSRPDVAALYANYPRASRAGWGYLMLTRGLVWEGAGPFKLYAYAHDADGHITLLGSKTVGVNNAIATKPFGTIDTPGQGVTVSGMVDNFGWVLTRPGRTIPEQNVVIYIDGVAIGSPGGLSTRPDLEAAFGGQGFDTSQAQRVLTFDSRNYSDGLHTIGWLVIDSTGEADGVGSRFFRILNAAGGLLKRAEGLWAKGSLFTRPAADRRTG